MPSFGQPIYTPPPGIVVITGGSINGTSIGATTPSTGAFTTLSASSTVTGIGLIGIQTFCSSGCSSTGGTYTPDAGTQSVIVEVQGAGGGGGGAGSTGASQSSIGSAGGSSSYGEALITSGFSGATITVPAGGAGGSAGDNSGTSGSSASFGSLISCPGGSGGTGGAPVSGAVIAGIAGSSSACTFSGSTQIKSVIGAATTYGIVLTPGGVSGSSSGANSILGLGGQGRTGGNSGGNAFGYGAGGGGANQPTASSSAEAGGAGSQSIVIVYEYN